MEIPVRPLHSPIELLIETPKMPTNKVVMFFPGISGGAFSERFQPLVDACHGAGLAIARVSAWKGAEEAAAMDLTELFKRVDDAVTYLRRRAGYKHIYGVRKSFGGAALLMRPTTYLKKRVVWAPAVGVTESDNNVETYLKTPLGELPVLMDLHVDRAALAVQTVPTLFIHGTADENIPLENSKRAAAALPHASLVTIDGADHSLPRSGTRSGGDQGHDRFLCS